MSSFLDLHFLLCFHNDLGVLSPGTPAFTLIFFVIFLLKNLYFFIAHNLFPQGLIGSLSAGECEAPWVEGPGAAAGRLPQTDMSGPGLKKLT